MVSGGDGNDRLTAIDGADEIDGGAGADQMGCGPGQDIAWVDNKGDQPHECETTN